MVGDVDDDPPVDGGRAHLDGLALGRVLDGVVDQVRQHLPKPRAVTAHERQRARDARDDLDRVLAEAGRGDGLLDDPREVDVAEGVLNVPASMRDVSSTSPTSAARRSVSSAISARNASRCSDESSRHRCCSVRAEPITAARGVRSSCETSETKSARNVERRRSSSTVRRSAS